MEVKKYLDPSQKRNVHETQDETWDQNLGHGEWVLHTFQDGDNDGGVEQCGAERNVQGYHEDEMEDVVVVAIAPTER